MSNLGMCLPQVGVSALLGSFFYSRMLLSTFITVELAQWIELSAQSLNPFSSFILSEELIEMHAWAKLIIPSAQRIFLSHFLIQIRYCH